MPASRIPDDDARQMCAEYESAAEPSLKTLSARWGWSQEAIRQAIVRAGGAMRPAERRIPDDAGAKLRRQYERGLSLEAMSGRWGWSKGAIRDAIVRAGGTIRPKRKPRRLPTAEHLLTLYEGGMSRVELAAYAGTGITSIDGMLSRARRQRREAMLARVAAMEWERRA